MSEDLEYKEEGTQLEIFPNIWKSRAALKDVLIAQVDEFVDDELLEQLLHTFEGDYKSIDQFLYSSNPSLNWDSPFAVLRSNTLFGNKMIINLLWRINYGILA